MRSIIGTTAGDPAGIGLEVVLKTIGPVLESARWVLFTDRAIFLRNVALFDPGVEYRWIEDLSGVTDEPVLFLRDLNGEVASIEWGRISVDAGRRALAYLNAASTEALADRLHGIVTA